MFTLHGNLKFVNISQKYLSKLHDACSEVYYYEKNYENKPYIGILLNQYGKSYVIPLSSAKEKHKTWKDVDKYRFLIYEKAYKEEMKPNDIWVEQEDENTVKHILAVMDIKKMIPVLENVYQEVNLNPDGNDTEEIRKYKDLLNKEYSFCIKIIDKVLEKADRLYANQMKTGKVQKFCCDFKVLEKACDTYRYEQIQ